MEASRPEHAFGRLLGASPQMAQVFDMIAKAAETAVPVLIAGETGTGKELVAREIHARSLRKDAPFVAVNTGALSRELVASELFGHVKGAFTGATENSMGRFAEADTGTLFLDEVATMSEHIQVVFLRVLEEGAFRPVGAKLERTVDVRVVAATNADLRVLVNTGAFREDLLQRLTVFRIVLPPLREHLEDLPMLARHFLDMGVREFALSATGITDEAIAMLCDYSWPGNVRELRNAVIQSAIMAGNGPVLPEHIPPRITAPLGENVGKDTKPDSGSGALGGQPPPPSTTLTMPVGHTLDELQKAYTLRTLAHCGDNKAKAARMLGISRKTLRQKLDRWGVASGAVENLPR